MAPVKRKSEEKIQEKTKEEKQNKPIRERAKGIVINEVSTKSKTETDTAESTTKKGTKRKKEYVVKSLYSLRSGLKGPGVDVASVLENTKAEKPKEKISDASETDSNEVCENGKNGNDSDDSDGDGGEKSNYKLPFCIKFDRNKSVFGLKLDVEKLAEEINAGKHNIKLPIFPD